jgi:hypothetical protein
MTQPDWHCAEDYTFTKKLDNAGWAWEFLRRNPEYIHDWKVAVQQQQKFIEHQAGNKFNAHRNPYVMFDPPLPSDVSPDDWLMKEGNEYHGPLAGYGKKWRLDGHIHDPTNASPPKFDQVASTNLLDWEELGEYYTPVSECSDIQRQMGHIAVVGIDLSRTVDSIKSDLNKIITREKATRSVSKISQIHPEKNSNWPVFLRILDAKRLKVSHAKIGAKLMPQMDEADAKSVISRYLNKDIARLFRHDVYIRIANNCPG